MNDYITHLVQEKSFEQLNSEEREQVLAAMSEAEYTRLRAVLLTAPALDAEVMPPTRLRAALLQQFMQQAPPPEPRQAWLNRPIPLWQAAAAVLLVVGAFLFIRPERSIEAPPAVVQTVIRADTVFQERIVWKERVVVRYKTVSQTNVPPIALEVFWPLRDSVSTSSPNEESEPVSGVSIARQPELLRFFTQANK